MHWQLFWKFKWQALEASLKGQVESKLRLKPSLEGQVESKLCLEASWKGQVESKLHLEASLEGQVALGVRLGGPKRRPRGPKSLQVEPKSA